MLETLKGLGVPRASLDNMITVGNKMDLVPPGEWPRLKKEWGLLPISAKEGFGLGLLARTIETKILTLTGRQQLKVTVPAQARAAKTYILLRFPGSLPHRFPRRRLGVQERHGDRQGDRPERRELFSAVGRGLRGGEGKNEEKILCLIKGL